MYFLLLAFVFGSPCVILAFAFGWWTWNALLDMREGMSREDIGCVIGILFFAIWAIAGMLLISGVIRP